MVCFYQSFTRHASFWLSESHPKCNSTSWAKLRMIDSRKKLRKLVQESHCLVAIAPHTAYIFPSPLPPTTTRNQKSKTQPHAQCPLTVRTCWAVRPVGPMKSRLRREELFGAVMPWKIEGFEILDLDARLLLADNPRQARSKVCSSLVEVVSSCAGIFTPLRPMTAPIAEARQAQVCDTRQARQARQRQARQRQARRARFARRARER